MVVRAENIGILGRAAGDGVYIADELSLANALGAHLRVDVDPRYARIGHSHIVPMAWDLARFATPASDDDPSVTAARRALQCGELHELLDDITKPMTFRRFFSNLLDAPRLTFLRVPSDPRAAEKEMCKR
jgi:arabinofuranosyltransferase